MKTKTIGEKEFTFREKKEITWGAENRAREFIKKHLLEVDTNMIGMMKGAKISDSNTAIDFDQMFSNPGEMANYLQTVDEQKEKNEIAAIMLVTNLEYSDLEELSVTTMLKLSEEVKVIVKDATDFLNGLGINTQSKLTTESPIPQKAKVET